MSVSVLSTGQKVFTRFYLLNYSLVKCLSGEYGKLLAYLYSRVAGKMFQLCQHVWVNNFLRVFLSFFLDRQILYIILFIQLMKTRFPKCYVVTVFATDLRLSHHRTYKTILLFGCLNKLNTVHNLLL